MERIETAGAGFRSLADAIDITEPGGRMMMQMVGSFADFERGMICERTLLRVGLGAIRGQDWRRKKFNPKKRLEIAASVLSGRLSR